ncbi:MAG: PAN domain-containing protein [Phyllobacteriaceae bacterium]|nr:PAN domain-containing protein [Phyllobacteriaceae bacterium]
MFHSPLMKKFTFALALVVLSVGAVSAMEFNKNRPGGDFMHFPLVAPLPAQCEAACNSNAACKAWTYVKPGHQGPLAQCWLKSSAPAKVSDSCCVSGKKAAPAATLDFNTDRPGSDFTDVTLPNGSTYKACRTLCNADGDCKAWTFVKPGYQGSKPRCWLKNGVPAKVSSACCTSGVK